MPIVRARIAIPSNKADLDGALEGLVRLNIALMRQAADAGRPVPLLFKSGVHWQPDRERGKPTETWDSCDVCIARGYGDCEDLASWRAAELRYRANVAARAVVRPSRSPGVAWHCIVELPNGKFEDPSVKCGMYEMQRKLAARRGVVGADVAPGLVYVDAAGADIGADLARALTTTAARLTRWAQRIEAKGGKR